MTSARTFLKKIALFVLQINPQHKQDWLHVTKCAFVNLLKGQIIILLVSSRHPNCVILKWF